ncbi:hypothetical protein [Emticicia sp. BO119]|uniref:hypothetical protein n=1 Tax=Emticicia sp. BO119 TaxID=2757768 RepID=UPI0015F04D23|nr:hypothetical protein [Emticicia sp. BO119]MBA4848985.1 hypothetical protein [Emticicia sp. BO119]
MGLTKQTDPQLNELGKKFFESPESEKKRFIEIAEEKAIEQGEDSDRNFRRIFQETYARCPIANVYPFFLHAAHMVWGLNFDFSLKTQATKGTTVHTVVDGSLLALTIEKV